MCGFQGHVMLQARNASVVGLTGHLALPCRVAHPLLPALTSPHGQEDLSQLEKWKSIFSYPLGERAWGGQEGAGAVRLQGESSLPAESEKMHLGPFSPLRDGFSASGAGWSSTGPGLREAGSTQRPWVGELTISPGPPRGRCWGRGGGAIPAPRTSLGGPYLCSKTPSSHCLYLLPPKPEPWGQTAGG